MAKKRNSLVASLIILSSFSAIADEAADEAAKARLAAVIENYTVGNNSLYNKVISAGKTLDASKSDSDRIKDMNSLILGNFSAVITAFTNATEEKKQEAVTQAVTTIDNEMLDTADANIVFTDGMPSAAIARVVLMIERKSPEITAEKVMQVMTSYRRSPKPSDYVYEYEKADNITQGTIKEVKASDTSWLMPEASASVKPNEDLVIKKCRQIMGWKCVTSLYSVGEIAEDGLQYFFLGGYDLKNNPDHSDFTADSRSKNQVAGSTAMYIAKQSEKWILIYGIDSSYSNSKLAFTPLIEEALQKDFANLQKRLVTDLELDKIIDQKPPKKVKLSLKDRIAKFFLKLKKKK